METQAFADVPGLENLIFSLSAPGTAQRVLGGISEPSWQQGVCLGFGEGGMCGPAASGSAVLEGGTG